MRVQAPLGVLSLGPTIGFRPVAFIDFVITACVLFLCEDSLLLAKRFVYKAYCEWACEATV